MKQSPNFLSRFRRRVLLAKAWKMASWGLCLAAGVTLILGALDFWRVQYVSVWILVLLPILGAVLGALLGLLQRTSLGDLAQSIDRRANLADRVTTMSEDHEATALWELQERDAHAKLDALKPGHLYPIRLTRWHGLGLVLVIATASLFLLGNSGVLIPKGEKMEREDLAKIGEQIERVAKPVAEEEKIDPEVQQLAKEFQKLSLELQKKRVPKAEALAKMNELNEQSRELANKNLDQAEEQTKIAEQALMEKAEAQARAETGIQEPLDEQMRAQSREELEQMAKQGQADLQKLESQLQSGKNGQGQSMSEQERKQIESQVADLNRQLQQIELSQAVQDMMKRMQESKEWAEIQKLMQKMQKQISEAKKGEQKNLTKEQIEEMQEMLEELAERLKDDEEMKAFLEAMKEALENMKEAGQCEGMCLSMGMPIPGASGPGQDNLFRDTQVLPLNKDEQDIQSRPDLKAVRGERREEGPETYVEVRGPSALGERSKVPFSKVLPQYKQQAESALRNGKIPKKHEGRVRDYFNSLSGEKK